MAVLAALESVSLVTWFDEDTPLNLILACKPGRAGQRRRLGRGRTSSARGKCKAGAGTVHSIPFLHRALDHRDPGQDSQPLACLPADFLTASRHCRRRTICSPIRSTAMPTATTTAARFSRPRRLRLPPDTEQVRRHRPAVQPVPRPPHAARPRHRHRRRQHPGTGRRGAVAGAHAAHPHGRPGQPRDRRRARRAQPGNPGCRPAARLFLAARPVQRRLLQHRRQPRHLRRRPACGEIRRHPRPCAGAEGGDRQQAKSSRPAATPPRAWSATT